MVRQCWASILGNCEGPLTGEHLVTQAHLGPTVEVCGLHWCMNELKTVGSAGLTCKCLCRHHNNALSPIDQELMKFRGAIEGTFQKRPPNSPFFWYQVDGLRLGRWVAKTVCTQAAAAGFAVPVRLARYAFADVDDQAIRLYSSFRPGSPHTFDVSHIGTIWLHDRRDENNVAVHVRVFDFPFVISTFSLRPFWPAIAEPLGYPFEHADILLDRVARLDIKGRPGPRGCVLFNWDSRFREAP